MKTVENANQIPLEIKNSSRFFAVGTKNNPKAPKVKDWSNPDNQTTLEMIDGAAGFDTCGHGKDVDYLFLDFDHVLTDDGEFVNDNAAKMLASIKKHFPQIYIEKSVSKHGLHAFLIPTADKFGMFNAGSKATVYFSESREKDAPKLEIFYKSKARYCLLTGDLYTADTGAEIPSGDAADELLNKLVEIIEKQRAEDHTVKTAIKEVTQYDTPQEYTRDLAMALWQFGNFADAPRADWLPCISAMKNLGFSLTEVKSMCEHSERYNENAFDAEFDSLTDISNFGIETLIGKCRTFDFKAFKKQWYQRNVDENNFDNLSFVDKHLKNLVVPKQHQITENGVLKLVMTETGEWRTKTICPRPLIINGIFYNLEEKTFKVQLEYMANHKWRAIPPQAKATIFNKNKIVDLTNYGLPVTSSNSKDVVNWLFDFELANENNLPLTYTVNRCGWYTYKNTDYFIDPRIENIIQDGDKNINLVVDSDNQMAKDLTTAGSLENWKKAYLLAHNSTIARFNVASAVAPALLKVLDERNFVCYTYGKTRGGKSTSLYLAASAVGNSGLVRVFDATNNGLTAAAMNTNHYPFFVDEKQSADQKLKDNFQSWVYNDANGTERTRADKNGNPRPVKTWRHITLCNGEAVLLNDNATGGAHTRILQIAAPEFFFSDDKEENEKICKEIQQIIKDNYGHVYPLFIQQLQKENLDELREKYSNYQDSYKYILQCNTIDLLPDYVRYVALICIADEILNKALEINIDGNALNYAEIFRSLPSIEETDDTTREENIVSVFIAMKAQHFDSAYNKDGLKVDCYGKYKDGYLYVIAAILNQYLVENGYTPAKVAADLVKSGYFIPADKVNTGEGKKPRDTVQVKINGKNQRCYKIKIENDEEE